MSTGKFGLKSLCLCCFAYLTFGFRRFSKIPAMPSGFRADGASSDLPRHCPDAYRRWNPRPEKHQNHSATKENSKTSNTLGEVKKKMYGRRTPRKRTWQGERGGDIFVSRCFGVASNSHCCSKVHNPGLGIWINFPLWNFQSWLEKLLKTISIEHVPWGKASCFINCIFWGTNNSAQSLTA